MTNHGCGSCSTSSSSGRSGGTPTSRAGPGRCGTGGSTGRTSSAPAPRRRRTCTACWPPSPGRHPTADVIDELVSCPLPLLPILAGEDPLDWASDPFPLLEVLTRRYYSIRELGDMRREAGGLLRTSYAQGSHRPRARRLGRRRIRPGVLETRGARRVATSSLPTPWSSISTWRPRPATPVEVDELREALARVALART